MIGETLDSYKILEVLGKGGMGVVYKALDTSLDKTVALKIMHPMVAENDEFLRRFKAEARALGRLHHPHIVGVFAFRHTDAHLFIVMEYLEGGTITQLIREKGRIPWQESIPIIKQSLEAIGYAHQEGIIHRDIKPSNILLNKKTQVKVMDFGLAKIQDSDADSIVLTRTGVAGGTLYYMPPEQLEGLAKVDHRCDIYAMGMTFYQMLAGKTPLHAHSTEIAIIRAIDRHNYPSVREFSPDVPEGIAHIITKAIARSPDDRFQTAEEMITALEAFETGTYEGAEEFAPTVMFNDPLPPIPATQDPASNPTWGNTGAGSGTFNRPDTGSSPSFGTYGSGAFTPPSGTFGGTGTMYPPAPTPSASWKKPALFGGIAVLLLLIGYFLLPFIRGNETPTTGGIEQAYLSIESPAGGIVSVNGNLVARIPFTDKPIPSGEVKVTIEQSGYQNRDTTLTLATDEMTPALTFKLQPESSTTPDVAGNTTPTDDTGTSTNPATNPEQGTGTQPEAKTGSVRINSEPRGAAIYIDGRRQSGTSPKNLNLATGAHRLELRLDGHETYKQRIQVSPQAQTRVNATLSPLLGFVRVVVRPYGDIFVDGQKKANQTNKALTEQLLVGMHKIRATHPTKGTWTKDIRVQKDGTTEIVFNFNQEMSLTATSTPRNAEILVDGNPIGKNTPSVIKLPPGQHLIEIRKNGYQSASQRVTLESNRNLHFDLKQNQ